MTTALAYELHVTLLVDVRLGEHGKSIFSKVLTIPLALQSGRTRADAFFEAKKFFSEAMAERMQNPTHQLYEYRNEEIHYAAMLIHLSVQPESKP